MWQECMVVYQVLVWHVDKFFGADTLVWALLYLYRIWPRSYQELMSAAKERQTTVHCLVPSSVEFGTSKMRLIR